MLVNVLGEFGIEENYSYEDIISGGLSSEDVDRILSKKLALNYNGLFTIYISGVYKSDEIEMRFPNELITEMKIVNPIRVDIYANKADQVPEIKDDINKKYDFKASAQLETLKDNISMQTRFFTIALILLGIVLICISCALLSSFSKISVLERKKEVAIIKSLGASNRSVLFILLFDSAAISILSFFISLIIFAVLKFSLPYVLPNIELLTTGFPIMLIILINIAFTAIIFLQTGLVLRKLVKQMPAQLLTQ